MRESEKVEFENFKDNFLFEFVFKAIERPNFLVCYLKSIIINASVNLYILTILIK